MATEIISPPVRDVEGQVCCGALHGHTGLREEARALARANVAAFGDGPDAVRLAELAGALGWVGRLVRKGDPDGPLDDRTAAVLMTHNVERDRELLGRLVVRGREAGKQQ